MIADSSSILWCTFLLAGVVSGIISSVPVGPTNLWLTHSTLVAPDARRDRSLFLVGIISMDIFYALVAGWGYYAFIQGSQYGFFLIGIAAVSLICLGIHDLRHIWRQSLDVPEPDTLSGVGRVVRGAQCLGLGVLLGINPGFVVYWLGVARVLENIGYTSVTLVQGLFFGLGILLGDIIWYALLIHIVSSSARFLSPSNLKKVRAVVAAGFIVFGVSLLWNIEGYLGHIQ